jgi:uncharacterized protein YbjT (DUF2867 family)
MNTPQGQPTLVLGGTGKTGRRVVERLEARGLPVRVGARSGKPPFDWEDHATWATALDGVSSVYVSHYLDALPGAAETVGAFAEQSVASGPGGWYSCPAVASARPSSSSRPCATRAPS